MSRDCGENLAIRLTAPATAALAVVRLQGPAAGAFIARCFDRPTPPGACVHGRWRGADGQVLDDPLVVAGDGWYDINLHGGRRIVARLLEQTAAHGFRIIESAEAMEAVAADAVEAWLPLATTEAGVSLLLAQPQAWRSLDPDRVDVEAMLSDLTLRRLLTPATVAIVGAPNVGKSTLANALFGRERSIVADVPGTTRDWVGGRAELAGLPVVLVDTPGRRETPDEIEREAIALAEAPVSQADLVLLVMDATRPADLPPGPAGALCVANKTDLAPAAEGWLPISAASGVGLDALIEAIHRRLGVSLFGAHQAKWWTDQHERLLRGSGARAVTQIAHQLAMF